MSPVARRHAGGSAMGRVSRPTGSVDISVLTFPASSDGRALGLAIAGAIETGVARVLDAVWIRKDASGTVTDLSGGIDAEAVFGFDVHSPGLFGRDDVDSMAGLLPDGCAGAVIAWENLWSARVDVLVAEAGGSVVAQDHIDSRAVADIFEVIDLLDADAGPVTDHQEPT